MGKPSKLAGRKPPGRPRADDSALARTAASIGRMIGALQRTIDDAGRRPARTPSPNGRAAGRMQAHEAPSRDPGRLDPPRLGRRAASRGGTRPASRSAPRKTREAGRPK